MRIFVTGGSGFVGGHVIEHFARQGHDVRAMARSDASARAVEAFGARAVRCSLDDVGPEHLGGVDAVVHAAAFVEEWGTREEFYAANVAGTERMLAAARQAGVKRFLHVGTEAALFDGRDLVNVDEHRSYPARQRYLYSETKAEAEKRVLAANDAAMTAISLRPRFIWGPRDATLLPAILEMAKLGRFAWIDRGEHLSSTCHVANLVHAIELALTRGRGGQSYFVADDGARTYRDMLTRLARTANVELPKKSVPGWLARGLAALVEWAWRLFRLPGRPPMTRFAIAMMASTVTVSTEKAKRELGYEPIVGVDAGLRELGAG